MDKSGLVEIEVQMDFRARDGTPFYAQEKRLVTEEQRARFCAAGWAKDPTGSVQTGTPDRGASELTGVRSTKHTVTKGGS